MKIVFSILMSLNSSGLETLIAIDRETSYDGFSRVRVASCPCQKGAMILASRSEQLFNLVRQISDNIQLSAEIFHSGIIDLPDAQRLASKMKDCEREGDKLIGEVISLLNATYITPLDREDFLSLGSKMDDIVDGLEACSVRLDVYDVRYSTSTMTDFADLIKECCGQIGEAVGLLCKRQLAGMQPYIETIHDLERTADEVLRSALRELFRNPKDPYELIKLKEIYEILESVTDRCKDVADLLESVLVKHA